MVVRKLVIAAAAVLALSFATHAEIQPNAIGLRLGAGGDVLGGELNYQRGMGSNRLELGASFDIDDGNGWSYSYIGVNGIYQWYWNISGGFSWYAGPGAGVGIWMFGGDNVDDDSGLWVNIGGQVGIEHDFNAMGVPLNLSLDVRPMFGLIDEAGFGWGLALGIRYTF